MTTLIRAAFLVTMDDALHVVRHAAVVIDGPAIVAVGPWTDLHTQFPTATVVGDGTGIVLPGLVNAHTHFSEGLLASLGEGMTLYEWGERIIIPAGRALTRELARIGTLLKGCELLASGVTTVNDMFVHGNPGSFASLGVVDALEQLGLRGVVCFGAEDVSFNRPEFASVLHVTDVLEEHDALAARAQAAARVSFRLGIGTLAGQSRALLAASVALAHARGWDIHTHLAEVREEVSYFRTTTGQSPIAFAAAHGLLDRPLIAAHCNWLSEADLRLLVDRRVQVVHNPIANMILASGICPVPRLLSQGVTVSLGTDGAASNNNQNMFQVMKTAALLHKIATLDATALSATQVLWMATRGGAQALGLDAQIGSIEVGKRADLVLLDGHTPTLTPMHDPYGQVVYAATGREVSDVWVDGAYVVQHGQVTCVDAGAVCQIAETAARDLLARVPALQRWSYLSNDTAPP